MTLFGTTRHSGYGFETQHQDSWVDQAACRTEDPNLFHRLSVGDPGTGNMTAHEVKKLEISNFEKARKICAGCPVVKECTQEGQKRRYNGDTLLAPGSTFSVYGGNLPDGYSLVMSGRPKKHSPDALANRICTRGHKGDWRREGDGGYRCRTCDRLRKYGVVSIERVGIEEKHLRGLMDHPFEPAVYSGKLACKACRRETNRKFKENRKAGVPLNENLSRSNNGIDWDKRHLDTKGHEPVWGQGTDRRWCKVCDAMRKQAKTHAAKRQDGIYVDKA